MFGIDSSWLQVWDYSVVPDTEHLAERPRLCLTDVIGNTVSVDYGKLFEHKPYSISANLGMRPDLVRESISVIRFQCPKRWLCTGSSASSTNPWKWSARTSRRPFHPSNPPWAKAINRPMRTRYYKSMIRRFSRHRSANSHRRRWSSSTWTRPSVPCSPGSRSLRISMWRRKAAESSWRRNWNFISRNARRSYVSTAIFWLRRKYCITLEYNVRNTRAWTR